MEKFIFAASATHAAHFLNHVGPDAHAARAAFFLAHLGQRHAVVLLHDSIVMIEQILQKFR